MKYKLIKEHLFHPELGSYTTYGIAVYDGKHLVRKISDVSTDKHRVRKLCRLCNRLRLDLEQLTDVIEDFICV